MKIRLAKLIAPLLKILMLIFGYRLLFGTRGPEIIKIVSANSSSGELVLKDAGNNSATTFKVKAGRTINWLVNTNNVRDIVNIYKKPSTPGSNLFISGPSRIGSSRNWTATINPAAVVDEFIEYNIDWKDSSGIVLTYDPRIQVKS